jgi:putative acyl-CoA dehydrogenase
MECIGGSGVMEDSIMPRLFRESPVNAIWEGSGNIQCLDLLRALHKEPAALSSYFDEIGKARGQNDELDTAIAALKRQFDDTDTLESRARAIVESMALALAGALLVQYAPDVVATAFCASRLGQDGRRHLYGALPAETNCEAIIARAFPRC